MLKVAKGARFVVVVKYTVKVTQDIDLRSRLSELGVVAQSENVFFSLIQNKKYYDGRSRRKEKNNFKTKVFIHFGWNFDLSPEPLLEK